MNLGEKLKKLISDNVDSARPFFAIVVKQNEDFTWQVQPIDEQPIIYNAQTFQEDADGNTPAIGSLVLCIYIDQFSCFITEIIDYDDWYVNTNKTVILGSQDAVIVNGKRVLIDSSGVKPEDLKQYLENNANSFSISNSNVEEFATIQSKGNVLLLSTDGNVNQPGTELASIRVSNSGVSNNPSDGGIVLNNETSLNTYILSTAQMEIFGNSIVIVSGNGLKLVSNQILLNDLLSQITSMNDAITAMTAVTTPSDPTTFATAKATFDALATSFKTAVTTYNQ